jgi:hypothetical protein
MKAGRASIQPFDRHERIRQMRKVTAGLFSSIDGVVEATATSTGALIATYRPAR